MNLQTTPRPDFAAIIEQARRDALWVLPACEDPAEKHPCVDWIAFQSRAPSPQENEDFLKRFPGRNGTYVTGPALGRFILDADGLEANEWVEVRGGMDVAQIIESRRYHRQFHFAYPGFRVYNSAGELYRLPDTDDPARRKNLAQCDIRGQGGIAVACGSIHYSGSIYHWIPGHSPQDLALSPAPSWLLDWLREQSARKEQHQVHIEPRAFSGKVMGWARTAINGELERLHSAVDGTKQMTMASVSFKLGQLAGGGEASASELLAGLYEIADHWPNKKKSRSTIDRCFEAGTGQPRSYPGPEAHKDQHLNNHTNGTGKKNHLEVDFSGPDCMHNESASASDEPSQDQGKKNGRVGFPSERAERALEIKPPDFPQECIIGTAKHWINNLKDRGEWPVAFLFAEWRQIHSMLMERKIGFGGKPRFAHCQDFLIGPSALSHKSESIGRAASVIQAASPGVLDCRNISSVEGILDLMTEDPRTEEEKSGPAKIRAIALIAQNEYSYLVATNKRQTTSNIIPVFNDAYDGVDPLTLTRRKSPVVPHPFLNLMTGTTPDWMQSYADKEGADLGRFNRSVVFYSNQEKDIARPKHLSAQERQEWADHFKEQITKAVNSCLDTPAKFLFCDSVEKRFDEWFQTFRIWLRALPDPLRKLFSRNEDHVQIQTMIYATADGRCSATLDDLEAAIAFVEWNQKNKLMLFADVEFSEDQRLERLMRAFVDHNGGTLKQLYAYLGSKGGSAEAVHRKLKSFAALGLCTLSRSLDDRSREPLIIRPLQNPN
jgi:hypothetical protein